MIGFSVGRVFVAGRPTRAVGGLGNAIATMIVVAWAIIYFTVWALVWAVIFTYRGCKWFAAWRRRRKVRKVARVAAKRALLFAAPPTGPRLAEVPQ